MIFGPKLKKDIAAEDFSIVVNDQIIEIREEAKSLGVTLHLNLRFKKHVPKNII